MIRYIGTYKISILKEDIKHWDGNEYVLVVRTTDLNTADRLEAIIRVHENLKH